MAGDPTSFNRKTRPRIPPPQAPLAAKAPQRSQSAERRRPMARAANVLIASSASISQSFQGASLTLSSKAKTTPRPRSSRAADEAHNGRIFLNRLLQWRFVNARGEASARSRASRAERGFCMAERRIAAVVESVKWKRIEMQGLNQEVKLILILRNQMAHLNEAALIIEEHSRLLEITAESLKMATIGVPLVDAEADVEDVKYAMMWAFRAIEQIYSVIRRVGANDRVSELARIAADERSSLAECLNVLSTIAALQVKDHSLRLSVIQRRRLVDCL